MEGRPAIVEALRGHGFEPVEPSVANFVFAEVGDDSRPSSSSCCARGDRAADRRVWRPGAIRVTVGTPEENAFFRAALGRVTELART